MCGFFFSIGYCNFCWVSSYKIFLSASSIFFSQWRFNTYYLKLGFNLIEHPCNSIDQLYSRSRCITLWLISTSWMIFLQFFFLEILVFLYDVFFVYATPFPKMFIFLSLHLTNQPSLLFPYFKIVNFRL